ncbi:class I SAM-dependent DNA methyltransferase [Nakamurella sp.]|uniref:class I SAM-dependent DNA methyltransferase n=1 Tax=Nakamurella sp. TaxID=1869182 RepID=UPI003B3BC92D
MTGGAPYRRFAAVYDALLGDRSFPEMRLAFDRMCDRYAVHFVSAADIGCGTGTFVDYLCRTTDGPVWGVDLSPQMLEVAAAKNAGNRARFLCQDMRQLHLPQAVDLITCQFEALNYLTTSGDLQLTLGAFARSLTIGGAAIFDVTTERLHDAAEHQPVDLHRSATGAVTVRTAYDAGSRTQTARLEMADTHGTAVEIHRQRTHTVDDVSAAVVAAGLHLVAVHDLDEFLPPGGEPTGSRLFLARRS